MYQLHTYYVGMYAYKLYLVTSRLTGFARVPSLPPALPRCLTLILF